MTLKLEVLAKKNNTTIHDIVRFGIPLAGYLSVVKVRNLYVEKHLKVLGKRQDPDYIRFIIDFTTWTNHPVCFFVCHSLFFDMNSIDGNTYRINPKLIVRNDCFCLNSPYMSETNSEIKGYSVEVDAHEVDFQDLNTAQRIGIRAHFMLLRIYGFR